MNSVKIIIFLEKKKKSANVLSIVVNLSMPMINLKVTLGTFVGDGLSLTAMPPNPPQGGLNTLKTALISPPAGDLGGIADFTR